MANPSIGQGLPFLLRGPTVNSRTSFLVSRPVGFLIHLFHQIAELSSILTRIIFGTSLLCIFLVF